MNRVKHDNVINSSRAKLSLATTVSSNLKNGVLYQSHSASERNEAALLRVLTPSQTARFQQWMMVNQPRCRKLFGANSQHIETTNNCLQKDKAASDLTLSNVCEQLSEAMRITKRV